MPGYSVPSGCLQAAEDKDILCSACSLLIREAVQTLCGHRYCKTCVDELLKWVTVWQNSSSDTCSVFVGGCVVVCMHYECVWPLLLWQEVNEDCTGTGHYETSFGLLADLIAHALCKIVERNLKVTGSPMETLLWVGREGWRDTHWVNGTQL